MGASTSQPGGGLKQVEHPEEAFRCIEECYRSGRRIIPLFGAGISVSAGIPTSAALADYIVLVYGLAKNEGWSDSRGYLLRYGWPHRHDAWRNWLLMQNERRAKVLTEVFEKQRKELYHWAAGEELRRVAPLCATMGEQRVNTLPVRPATCTDYRALLLAVTNGNSSLVDAFFDHFVKDRQPTTAHQFIAFIVAQMKIDLILTTNFDSLIERALRNEGISPTVYEVTKHDPVPSSMLVRNQDISVVKLHGGTHALRAGYDLDESLSTAALAEIRGYFQNESDRGDVPPLLLVLGYSGSDRRVMDIVADHLQTSCRKDPGRPHVLWVLREGDPPPRLEASAKAAASWGTAGSFPVIVCKYRHAQLFLQEIHQVVANQHATSQTGYRVVVPMPPRLGIIQNQKRIRVEPQNGNFTIFFSANAGDGTSTALMKGAYRTPEENGRPPEIIGNVAQPASGSEPESPSMARDVVWIDAANFTTRAGLVACILDELSRLDRGHVPVSRALLLRDAEYHPKMGTDSSCNDNGQGSRDGDNDEWEVKVAARWIAYSLRRGNFVLAIDSLGEFAKPHPALWKGGHPIEDDRLKSQRSLLIGFFAELHKEYKKSGFGVSAVMLALTKMELPTTDAGTVEEQVKLILGRNVPANAPQTDAPPEDQRATAAVQCLEAAIGAKNSSNSHCDTCLTSDGAVMVAIASLLRGPRSRTALLVSFVRYLRLVKKSDGCLAKVIAERVEKLSSGNDIMRVAQEALQNAESACADGQREWPLLSRMEGGFYWMHLETRDSVYNWCVDDRKGLFPQNILAEVFGGIADFAFQDVYKRSHDVSVFIEFVYYQFLSVLYYKKCKDDRWGANLRAIVGAVEGEYQNLLTRGRVADLVAELTVVAKFLLDQIGQTNKASARDQELPKPRELAARLFSRMAKLVDAGGHPRTALRYYFASFKLYMGENKVAELLSFKEDFALLDELISLRKTIISVVCSATTPRLIEVASDSVVCSATTPRLIEIASDLAHFVMAPIVFVDKELDKTGFEVKTNPISDTWFKKERREKDRREFSNDVSNACLKRIDGLLDQGNDTTDLKELHEIRARIAGQMAKDRLDELLGSPHLKWICGRPRKLEDQENPLLKQVAEACDEALIKLHVLKQVAEACDEALIKLHGSLPLGPRGHASSSYLYAISGVACYHLGQEARAEVQFNRAQSMLSPQSDPNGRLMAAHFLCMRAECELIKFHRPPDNRPKSTGRGQFKREQSSCLETAGLFLKRAEVLFASGRLDNLWYVNFLFLRAAVEFGSYLYAANKEDEARNSGEDGSGRSMEEEAQKSRAGEDRSLKSHAEASNKRPIGQHSAECRKNLLSALQHLVSAETSTGMKSDRRILFRVFFDLIERNGKDEYDDDEWSTERSRCGIPQTPEFKKNGQSVCVVF